MPRILPQLPRNPLHPPDSEPCHMRREHIGQTGNLRGVLGCSKACASRNRAACRSRVLGTAARRTKSSSEGRPQRRPYRIRRPQFLIHSVSERLTGAGLRVRLSRVAPIAPPPAVGGLPEAALRQPWARAAYLAVHTPRRHLQSARSDLHCHSARPNAWGSHDSRPIAVPRVRHKHRRLGLNGLLPFLSIASGSGKSSEPAHDAPRSCCGSAASSHSAIFWSFLA